MAKGVGGSSEPTSERDEDEKSTGISDRSESGDSDRAGAVTEDAIVNEARTSLKSAVNWGRMKVS